jgi:hypothetical protein
MISNRRSSRSRDQLPIANCQLPIEFAPLISAEVWHSYPLSSWYYGGEPGRALFQSAIGNRQSAIRWHQTKKPVKLLAATDLATQAVSIMEDRTQCA